MISSKYVRQCVEVSSLSARFINLVKLAGPFVSPKGITLKWTCPPWVENAVLGLSSSFTSICRYPNAKDRKTIGHHPALPRHHRSSLTILHLSMYTNSVCGNQCTYGNFHHVSLPKQPDCSRGSAILQLYQSLAARPPLDLWYSATGRGDRKVRTLSEKLATRTRVCPAFGTTRERAILILEVPCTSFHPSRILGLPEFCS